MNGHDGVRGPVDGAVFQQISGGPGMYPGPIMSPGWVQAKDVLPAVVE